MIIMRLDKYLKVSRLIKRRPLAKKVADQGRIKINGSVAKAGTNLEIDDEIEITFGQTILTVKVRDLKDHVPKDKAAELFEVIKEDRVNIDKE